MTGDWDGTTTLTYPDGSIGDILSGAAAAYSTRPAMVDGDAETSYAALYRSALRLANGLRDHGVADGYRVALILPNSAEFVTAYYAVLLAGAAVVPINPLQPRDALLEQLTYTDARAAIIDADHFGTFASVAERTHIDMVVTTGALDRSAITLSAPVIDMGLLIDAQPTSPVLPRVAADNLAQLGFTGGTTGRPKAVRVLHRHVIANVSQLTAHRLGYQVSSTPEGMGLRRHRSSSADFVLRPGEESTLVVAPFFHAHGLVSLSFFLLNGFTVRIYQGRFDPQRYLGEVVHRRISYLTASPPVWRAVCDVPDVGEMDLSAVKVVASGAAPLSNSLWRRLSEVFPTAAISEAYGMTEATMAVTAAPGIRTAVSPPGSVGQPLPDTEVQIRSPDGGGTLPVGERGEVWVRGPQVCAGYLGGDTDGFTAGWLRTGDIGSLDSEGFLRLYDRQKDMLIYKGYNVYPAELEEVIGNFPRVLSVAVVGRPDDGVGEEPVAFVVPRQGSQLTADELIDHVARRVVPYKRVREVFFVDELPTTPAGKILKRELRAQFADLGVSTQAETR